MAAGQPGLSKGDFCLSYILVKSAAGSCWNTQGRQHGTPLMMASACHRAAGSSCVLVGAHTCNDGLRVARAVGVDVVNRLIHAVHQLQGQRSLPILMPAQQFLPCHPCSAHACPARWYAAAWPILQCTCMPNAGGCSSLPRALVCSSLARLQCACMPSTRGCGGLPHNCLSQRVLAPHFTLAGLTKGLTLGECSCLLPWRIQLSESMSRA